MSYTLPSSIPWEEIANRRNENPTPVPHTAACFARWDYFNPEMRIFRRDMARMYLCVVAQLDGCLGALGELSAAAVTLLVVGLGLQRAPPRGAPQLLGRLRLNGTERGLRGYEDKRGERHAVFHSYTPCFFRLLSV